MSNEYMLDKDRLTTEEQIILQAIKSARDVQEYLWGEFNDNIPLEEWRRMLRKRVVKVDELDETNPHFKIELRKRLMQTAAVCVSLLGRLELNRFDPMVSNLPDYKTTLENQ